MAGQDKENGAYFSSKSLAEDYSSASDWIDVRQCSSGSFYLTWADAAATDAVVKAQESHDKSATTGTDISSASVTINAATGIGLIKLSSLLCPYVRLVIVDNSESAGTVNARYYFKGDR